MADYHKTKTRSDAESKLRHSFRVWREKIKVRYFACRLSNLDRKRVKSLFGLRPYSGLIRASDLAASRKLTELYIDVIDTCSKAHPELRWFHISLLCDEAVVSERKPNLALRRLKAKAYQSIRHLGLDAVICVDVNALPNYPQQGRGGCFLFHVHALCFTDKRFDIKEAENKLAETKSWSCSLGAHPTHIVEISKQMGSPSYWAAYDRKLPHEAKNLRVLQDGSKKLYASEKALRPTLALRLLEGLSSIALRDMLLSVGKGQQLRAEALRRVEHWHQDRWPGRPIIRKFDQRALWTRLWDSSRVKTYSPWSVVGASL